MAARRDAQKIVAVMETGVVVMFSPSSLRGFAVACWPAVGATSAAGRLHARKISALRKRWRRCMLRGCFPAFRAVPRGAGEGRRRRGSLLFRNGSVMAYVISDKCTKCGNCKEVCPSEAISEGEEQYVIDADACIDCGLCAGECPVEAISPGE
jgi:NAD-dependent dihydropyrimidine dehydrogenase PreA subunit